MRSRALILVCLLSVVRPAVAADDYTLGPDSQPQAGVPKGRVEGPIVWKSEVFADTVRQYWVYVPAQYDAAKPAALMVFQDGHAYVNTEEEYRVPVVFDNLIHKGQMPVTIGALRQPRAQLRAAARGPLARRATARTNTTPSGTSTPSFLIERAAPRGRQDLQARPTTPKAARSRAPAPAASAPSPWPGSGPTHFRKVISHIGSFARHPRRPRLPHAGPQAAKRPIRVFLQDGSNDLDNRCGQLAAGQPIDGGVPQVPRLRLSLRVRATGPTPTSTAARSFRRPCAGSGATTRSERQPLDCFIQRSISGRWRASRT